MADRGSGRDLVAFFLTVPFSFTLSLSGQIKNNSEQLWVHRARKF